MSASKALQAVVVCGPSGVGKGTLLKRLLSEYGNRFGVSVSHTTRAPREKEVNGVDYHFVDDATVEQMKKENKFLELCCVHGRFYGTSIAAVEAVEAAGKVCILEVDVNGAEKVKNLSHPFNAAYLFITAPRDELRRRIIERGSCNEKDVETRLTTAQYELDFLEKHPDFFQCVIENIDLEEAYHKVIAFLNNSLSAHGMDTLAPATIKVSS